jgi:hypothetical protein
VRKPFRVFRGQCLPDTDRRLPQAIDRDGLLPTDGSRQFACDVNVVPSERRDEQRTWTKSEMCLVEQEARRLRVCEAFTSEVRPHNDNTTTWELI